MTDFAAFSPGQQGLLAQQMQQGFGGSLLDHRSAMDFYRDMQVPVMNEPGDIPNYVAQRGLEATPDGSAPTPMRNPETGKVVAPVVNTPVAPTPQASREEWRRRVNEGSGGANR